MKILLISMAALSIGCAGPGVLSEEEILAQEPVVLERTGGFSTATLDENEAQTRLQTARESFLRGEYEACLETIRRTLEAGSPPEIAAELRSLRFDAKRRLLSRRVVAARVRPERDIFTVGEPIAIDLRVRNVSPQTLVIPVSEPGGSSSTFDVRVRRQDWDIYGNMRTVSGRYLVELEEDLEVPPGGDSAVGFVIPASESGERHLGFTVLRIEGVFRPASIRSGEVRYYSGVDLEGAVVRILPPGYEPLAADPVGSLEKAFRLRAREHLLVAAELCPPERRRAVLRRLVEYLDGASPAMSITLMTCLRRLTGRSYANRPEAWQAWWKEGGDVDAG